MRIRFPEFDEDKYRCHINQTPPPPPPESAHRLRACTFRIRIVANIRVHPSHILSAEHAHTAAVWHHGPHPFPPNDDDGGGRRRLGCTQPNRERTSERRASMGGRRQRRRPSLGILMDIAIRACAHRGITVRRYIAGDA